MQFKCGKGHTWEATYNSIQAGTWCPECHIHINEAFTRKVLETLTHQAFPKKRCIPNPSTGKMLELDGINESLKLAFEYNGVQHYEPHHKDDGDKNLRYQKIKDVWKVNWCKDNGFALIVIPHTIALNDIPAFISEHLNVEHKDPSTVDWEGIKNEIYQVAKEKKSRTNKVLRFRSELALKSPAHQTTQ